LERELCAAPENDRNVVRRNGCRNTWPYRVGSERAEFGDTRRQYIARIQLMTKTQTAVVHRLVWAPLHSNEHTHFPDCEAQDVQGDSISDIGIVGVESTFRPAVKNFEQLGL
jgi:hypothetical protein